MISYLPFVLVMITVPFYAAFTTPKNMTYSMEKGPSFQSICGRNVLLPVNGYNHELVSKGDAGGNCFATLVIGQTCKLTCKICVILEEETKLNLVADVMTITFTGEAESVLLKFGQAKFTETCFEGGRLDILVVEDEGYAKKWTNEEKPGNVYDFKFVLKPKCSDQPICECSYTMDTVNMSFSIINVFILVVLLVGGVYYICIQNQQNNTNRDQNEQGNQTDPQRRPLIMDPTNAPAMESNVDH